MSDNDVLEKLAVAVAKAGSQEALGKLIGLSGPFICLVLSGKRRVPNSILEYLGYERVITFKEKK